MTVTPSSLLDRLKRWLGLANDSAEDQGGPDGPARALAATPPVESPGRPKGSRQRSRSPNARPQVSSNDSEVESRFTLHDDAEIEELPDPEFLVEGLFPETSLAVLYGPPENYKTFLALDWAFSIATDQPWAGREVAAGPAVYVSAEGQAGLKDRVRAWKTHRGFDRGERSGSGVFFLTTRVQLLDDSEVSAFLRAVEEDVPDDPQMVVIDTLARCTPGADENSAQDMGRAVEAADTIRRETGASALFIHHAGREDQSHPRGSTALEGAADTIVSLRKEARFSAELSCEKQKDAERFDAMEIEMEEVDESLVSTVVGAAEKRVDLPDNYRHALETLAEEFGEDGASYTAWEDKSDLSHGTFDRARERLVQIELVDPQDGQYQPTSEGRELLTPTTTKVP